MQAAVLIGSIPRKPKGDIAITKLRIKGDWEEIQISFKFPPENTEKKIVNLVCKERPRSKLPTTNC
ncbi:MAG: hypothetical protein V7L23_30185 [Nostoc sp.]|uniref:hypothetical protein n=1 Tax=Nostoc sp. TaxID=1180 RepID=UPI002FF02359